VSVDGKQVRKQGYASREEAQDALDAYRAEQLAPPAPKTLEFGIAVDRVLDLKTRSSAATRRDYARIAKHLKAEFSAQTPVDEITADRIAEYEGKRLAATRKIGKSENAVERPLSLAALNRPRAFLRHVVRLAQEWGALASVPKIRCSKEKGRLRWLRPEEAVKAPRRLSRKREQDAPRSGGVRALHGRAPVRGAHPDVEPHGQIDCHGPAGGHEERRPAYGPPEHECRCCSRGA